MKGKFIQALLGAILLAAVLLGGCSAPAWGPAEREELGEPRLVSHTPDGSRA